MESKSIHSENESVSDSACAPLLQCMRTTAAVHAHHCCSACDDNNNLTKYSDRMANIGLISKVYCILLTIPSQCST